MTLTTSTELHMLSTVLKRYGLDEKDYIIHKYGTGLINHTWKIANSDHSYILQRINDNVFRDPHAIAHNLHYMSCFFAEKYPDYLFTAPLTTLSNEEMIYDEMNGYMRIFSFVPNSHTIDTVETPVQAYEAAKQFGRFTRLLSSFDLNNLRITIPDFHNLTLRCQQFENAVVSGNQERIAEAKNEITFLQQQSAIAETYEALKINKDLKLRVIHHDTKISNILFDENNEGLCVIDLDTVMPGYFISDVGDMMRTYLPSVNEEEKDFGKIDIREDVFKAIVEGYLSEMKEELTDCEKENFVYAGKFLIYMQALRFVTDYLNNDVYYGARYEKHNLVRGQNQIVLLQKLMEKEEKLVQVIEDYLAVNSIEK